MYSRIPCVPRFVRCVILFDLFDTRLFGVLVAALWQLHPPLLAFN